MNDKTSYAPERLHCQELGGVRTGILTLRKEQTELYFVGYDEFAYLSADGPAYVVTEEGKVASLHANVPGRDSSTSVATKFGGKDRAHGSDEYRGVRQSGIISNITLIGATAWRPEDLVRRLVFDVAHTEHILRHREKVRSLGRASLASVDDRTLYRAEVRNVALTAIYATAHSFYTQSLTGYHPTFSIEFKVGCPLDEIEVHLVRYLSFLSFVLGGPVTPTGVRLDRLSFEEIVREVEAGTYVGDHEVLWNWPADERESRSLAFHGAPFLAEDDRELAALAGC